MALHPHLGPQMYPTRLVMGKVSGVSRIVEGVKNHVNH
jgi:hypothetical protein